MKLIVISDIHGIKTNLEKVKQEFIQKKCDKLIVLGDIYDNRLKLKEKRKNDEEINKFLESFQDKLICIKGNCDTKEEIKNAKFPIIERLGYLSTNKAELYFAHGHLDNELNWNHPNTILIYGHLHIPLIRKTKTNIYINPGSISLPRKGYLPTYLYYDEQEFTIYDINENKIASIKIE